MKPDITPHSKFLAANWRELVFTLVGLLAFYVTVKYLLQWIDPTAGTSDFGMVDILLFATVGLLAAHCAVWIVLRIAMKTFSHYLDSKNFRLEWQDVRREFRIKATLLVIAFEVWAFLQFAAIAAGVK